MSKKKDDDLLVSLMLASTAIEEKNYQDNKNNEGVSPGVTFGGILLLIFGIMILYAIVS